MRRAKGRGHPFSVAFRLDTLSPTSVLLLALGFRRGSFRRRWLKSEAKLKANHL